MNRPLSCLQNSLAYIGFMKIHSFSYFFVVKQCQFMLRKSDLIGVLP
jgi:hypothetical protein